MPVTRTLRIRAVGKRHGYHRACPSMSSSAALRRPVRGSRPRRDETVECRECGAEGARASSPPAPEPRLVKTGVRCASERRTRAPSPHEAGLQGGAAPGREAHAEGTVVSATREERRERLVEVYREAAVCELCRSAETRTNVVFGSGNSDADLMFVGEAPGAEEDRQGLPFVGRAGGLLTRAPGGDRDDARGRVDARTCSAAARPATATRSRSRSRPASRT